MRNIDDGGASGRSEPDLLEQQLDQICCQGCRWFVKHQNLRLDGQRFCELDQLPLRNAHRFHPHPRVDETANLSKLFSYPIKRARLTCTKRLRHREEEVLGDRQVGQHGRVLVNQSKPAPLLRPDGRLPPGCLTADFDDTLVRLQVTPPRLP